MKCVCLYMYNSIIKEKCKAIISEKMKKIEIQSVKVGKGMDDKTKDTL